MRNLWILIVLSSFLALPGVPLAAQGGEKPAPKACPMKSGEHKNMKCGCKDISTCPCDCGCGDKKEAAKPASAK
jgi:hypothetical protein